MHFFVLQNTFVQMSLFLGLSVICEIIEKSDGKFMYDSCPNEGDVFTKEWRSNRNLGTHADLRRNAIRKLQIISNIVWDDNCWDEFVGMKNHKDGVRLKLNESEHNKAVCIRSSPYLKKMINSMMPSLFGHNSTIIDNKFAILNSTNNFTLGHLNGNPTLKSSINSIGISTTTENQLVNGSEVFSFPLNSSKINVSQKDESCADSTDNCLNEETFLNQSDFSQNLIGDCRIFNGSTNNLQRIYISNRNQVGSGFPLTSGWARGRQIGNNLVFKSDNFVGGNEIAKGISRKDGDKVVGDFTMDFDRGCVMSPNRLVDVRCKPQEPLREAVKYRICKRRRVKSNFVGPNNVVRKIGGVRPIKATHNLLKGPMTDRRKVIKNASLNSVEGINPGENYKFGLHPLKEISRGSEPRANNFVSNIADEVLVNKGVSSATLKNKSKGEEDSSKSLDYLNEFDEIDLKSLVSTTLRPLDATCKIGEIFTFSPPPIIKDNGDKVMSVGTNWAGRPPVRFDLGFDKVQDLQEDDLKSFTSTPLSVTPEEGNRSDFLPNKYYKISWSARTPHSLFLKMTPRPLQKVTTLSPFHPAVYKSLLTSFFTRKNRGKTNRPETRDQIMDLKRKLGLETKRDYDTFGRRRLDKIFSSNKRTNFNGYY